jgi:ubiquinol-cytochrome c reductase cytochrome b subunit
VILGYLGVVPSTGTTFGIPNTPLGQALTVYYFLFFLLMPIYTSIERCKPVPDRVTGGSH